MAGSDDLEPGILGIGRLFWAIRDAVVVGEASTGQIVLWNPAAGSLFGYSAAEVVGRPIDILVPDALKALHRAGLARFAETGRGPLLDSSTPVELPALHKDGSELTIELTLAPITDVPVPGTYVLAVIRDATARKQAEEERLALAQEQSARFAAEAGQQRLAFLAEVSSKLAESLDFEATLAAVARLAVPVLGSWCVVYVRAEDGAVHRLAVAAADPERAALTDEIQRRFVVDPNASTGVPRVIRTGRPEIHTEDAPALLAADVDEPEELARLLTEWRISAWMCLPLSARGQILGALSFVADRGRVYSADEEKLAADLARRAAAAIDNARLFRHSQASEARYRELFEGVADAILVADRGGRWRDANQAAQELLGYRRDELLELCVDDVVVTEPGAVGTAYPRWPAEGRWHGEVDLRRKDGETVPVDARVSLVALPAGQALLSVMRDISERRRLDRLQRDFLAMVTHDLRAPLTSTRAHAQLLARRKEFGEKNVHAILEATDRMTRLIDHLADVVRLESHAMPLRRQAVDLVTLVRTSVREVTAAAAIHQVEVIAPTAPVIGEWDADRVLQILQNLVGNAFQHAPKGGRIEVQVETVGTEARVTVRDEGPGIAPEHVAHLFDRFYRADASGAGGLGLGLYISRMLAEVHGGRIWVDSLPGKGSAFTVALPLVANEDGNSD